MSEKTHLVVGGNLEKALQGDYHFNIKAVLTEGWELTRHSKWAIVQGIMFVFSIALVLVILASDMLEKTGYDITSPNVQAMMNLVLTILLAPMMTGIIMMGVNHSIGGISKPAHLFFFMSKAAVLTLTALLMTLIVELGLSLLILPGLYLVVACNFSLPLVVEKGLSPTRAMLTSIKVVSFRGWRFMQLYAIFAVLFLVVIFSFGIALIWVAPLYYNVKGILYRDIFGITVKLEAGPKSTQKEESILNA